MKRHSFLLLLIATVNSHMAQTGGASQQHLALCAKCVSPTVMKLTGSGTSQAVAEARVTRSEAKGWCENWQPGGNLESCIREQLAQYGKETYRATADCTAGKITAIDGMTYTFAGIWANDVGKGRTKWRDASGAIVGQDNASGGLGISQQWEVLCPGPLKIGSAPAQRPSTALQRPSQSSAGTIRTQPENPSVCGGKANCTEVNSFAATLTDFRISAAGRERNLIATIGFQNKMNHPLILGFVQDAGVALDDQGNRYVVYGDAAVRGIGIISRNNVDTKFILQPGESSDSRFEFLFRHSREVLGITYQIDLTVREIVPIQGNQFRLGREHAIRFSNLGETSVSAVPQSTAPVTSSSQVANAPTAIPAAVNSGIPASGAAQPAPPVVSQPDACGGRPRCYGAGPFVAEVVQLTGSQAAPGSHHVLRANVRFRNTSSDVLVLAYKAKTSLATDNYGNPYYWGRAGTYDTSAQGIGTDIGRSVDSSFVLRPGESRNGTFQLVRYSPPRNSPLGTGFTWDLVVTQLEVLPNGQQVRPLRDHSLSFRDLTVSMANPGISVPSADGVNDAVKKLSDIFKKKR